ncbi:glycolate oxidase iron-sulfur subunit [Palleronia aestuarii]|uniref:Glycolate oxidase iron-sulfur subunit n=1 Tax=Palleronia aestuarii TaxID=568105 RepID=A0A2W7N571_9RHOB|nr:glycolate oxidase subunit GlcF [Palleronia aestuarii]PZX15221.1 glycolate oxidase iron-sulfur subunit [Palleronia aestuarii]
MQTNFTDAQLADPDTARSNEILRACVHCGFCTATCPTYQVLGDELDSPRGRIYLIKDMLENDRPADEKTVKHIDRCLSCLACMTTCPSGVHYQHLVDHARAHIEQTYRRPFMDRALRWTLARILPYPGRFRLALMGAKLGRPFARLMPDPRLRAMLAMAPATVPKVGGKDAPGIIPAEGERKKRVVLMTGCAQRVLDQDINAATIRLLTRLGCEIVIPQEMGCCGALVHHMGQTDESHAAAAKNISAWRAVERDGGLDAIVINTSGCGTTVKDYGHMFRTDDRLAEDARRISELTVDVTELLAELLPGTDPIGHLNEAAEDIAGIDAAHVEESSDGPVRVAYHSACSLQHGQKVTAHPKALLKRAGFEVVEPKDPHLCCGSAGTYNLMQPEISAKLKARKLETLEAKSPQIIAAGNIGCMVQIASGTSIPVVHTVELIDWATGGPRPSKLGSADFGVEDMPRAS